MHIPSYNEIVMMLLEIVVTLCADRALLAVIQPVGALPASVCLSVVIFRKEEILEACILYFSSVEL
jgi:hypothetical protein